VTSNSGQREYYQLRCIANVQKILFQLNDFFLWNELSIIMVIIIWILCHFTCWLGACVSGVLHLISDKPSFLLLSAYYCSSICYMLLISILIAVLNLAYLVVCIFVWYCYLSQFWSCVSFHETTCNFVMIILDDWKQIKLFYLTFFAVSMILLFLLFNISK
jgi:hypothetical protein